MDIAEVKARIDKQSTLLKWGLGLGAVAAGAVVGAFVIKGIVSLIVVALLLLAAVHGAPVVAMRFKNWKYAAIKEEARRNPVETLQAEYVRDKQALAEKGSKIERFAGKCSDYKDKLDGFIRGWPQDAAKFQAVYDGMLELLKRRRAKWLQAKRDLDLREKEIERADAVWQMVLASADLKEEAGDVEDQFISKMKRDTALDAVRSGFNQSMAELDTLLMEEVEIIRPDQPAITNQPPDVIEMSPVGQRVEVKR